MVTNEQLITDITEAVHVLQEVQLSVVDAAERLGAPMIGATADEAGARGAVPKPAAGDHVKYLRGDGTWQLPYIHPATPGNRHIPAGGSSGQILKWSDNGSAVWGDLTVNTIGAAAATHTHSASDITGGSLSADRIPNLNASKITAGTLGVDRIPSLDASKITTGTLNAARIPSLDASKITSGTISIDRLPAGALERLVVVSNQAARFALTTSQVQLGDTVKQTDTGVMYYVKDTTKLNSAAGYEEYTAGAATSVPWSGVTGKPSSFTPASHTHGNITNAGAIGTTSGVPIITGTNGVLQVGSFGTAAGSVRTSFPTCA